MRILIQRVTRAEVRVDNKIEGKINSGIVVLIGVASGDTRRDAEYLADKLIHLRIFPDTTSDIDGKMNRSAMDIGAGLLLISQFTLYGDCRKGRRPGFDAAAPPDQARELYQHFVDKVRQSGLPTETGVFQAHMEVELVNDGPVTFLLESPAV